MCDSVLAVRGLIEGVFVIRTVRNGEAGAGGLVGLGTRRVIDWE